MIMIGKDIRDLMILVFVRALDLSLFQMLLINLSGPKLISWELLL